MTASCEPSLLRRRPALDELVFDARSPNRRSERRSDLQYSSLKITRFNSACPSATSSQMLLGFLPVRNPKLCFAQLSLYSHQINGCSVANSFFTVSRYYYSR